ncbi:MAG TPA: amidohydrolase family protein [Thermodesulfobacteriota bacterium]|nr:amidohydrolase family protein [Thermodesulfobacteriota bacterium]
MKFVDAHTHMDFFALKGLPIDRAKTKREIIDMIESTQGKPLVVYGWSEETLGEPITRSDIDQFPFPILLIRVDAHVGVVNKKAVEGLKINPSERFDPVSGYIYEELLWSAASILKPKDVGAALLKAQEEAVSKGIIEIHDFADERTAKEYFKLRGEEKLKLRVVLMPYYDDYEKILRIFDAYGEDNLIRLGWIKTFADGSIGARTAYLRESYRDKPSHGILLKAEEDLVKMIKEIESRGFRVAIHAIGDKAIDVVLGAFRRANISLKGHRIEHAELIDSDQANKAKDMDITLCVQPNFNPVFMETYIKALGEERSARMNPLRMLDDIGVNLIFGSDMMPFEPKVGLDYASQILGKEKALYYYGGWENKQF